MRPEEHRFVQADYEFKRTDYWLPDPVFAKFESQNYKYRSCDFLLTYTITVYA